MLQTSVRIRQAGKRCSLCATTTNTRLQVTCDAAATETQVYTMLFCERQLQTQERNSGICASRDLTWWT